MNPSRLNFRTMLAVVLLALPCTVARGQEDPAKTIGEEIAIDTPAHLGGERFAVVIGIDDYQDPKIPDLATCENDAEAIYEALTDPECGAIPADNVQLLLGDDATAMGIKRALNDLRKVPADSTVFVYFSGHGAKEADEAFWLTADAVLGDLAITAIPDTDTHKFIERIPSSRVIVMLDCCYAAATIKDNKSVVDFTDVLSRFTGKGRAFLSAAGSGEEAIEARDLEHSVFSYYLIEGLRGQADVNDDGVVVLPELTSYIDEHVADEARRRGGIQRPVVDLTEVQEPSKFRLTIDAPQLRRAIEAARLAQLKHERRVLRLEELYLAERLDVNVYRLGGRLLDSRGQDLDEVESAQLAEFCALLDGLITLGQFELALAAIETPEEHRARLDRARLSDSSRLRFNDRWTNSIGMEFAFIEPGTYTKGSPEREADRVVNEIQHEVTLTHGQWMGCFEVTRGQFARFVSETGCRTDAEGLGWVHDWNPENDHKRRGPTWRRPGFEQTDEHPVVAVSWNDANAFCAWLSAKEGRTYRLPTDAEWEYACRAGTKTAYFWGDGPAGGRGYANVLDETCYRVVDGFGRWAIWPFDDGYGRTSPAGAMQPNPWGLSDMCGNVSEWCADGWRVLTESGDSVVDPFGTEGRDGTRMARGSSWAAGPAFARSAYRGFCEPPGEAGTWTGFRIVLPVVIDQTPEILEQGTVQ